MRAIEHAMNYDEVAQTWRGIVHDDLKLPLQSKPTTNLLHGWREDRTGQYGASLEQMTEWVDHGRMADGMDLKPGTKSIDRPKLKFNDFDGELDIERLLDGDDRPYRLRTKVKRQTGLSLRLQYNFLADVDAKVLADYAQWCAELIAGLQARGFDLQIDVFSSAMMATGRESIKVDSLIRVKRFGKRSSLKSWGALFSPAGYRMLGFTARMMACAKHKITCATNMGVSLAPGWDLNFDPETRTLTVTCWNKPGRAFPRDDLNTKVAALAL